MGWGKGKGSIVSRSCGHLSGQAENGDSPAVQSGRALQLGRCASPQAPPPPPELLCTRSIIPESLRRCFTAPKHVDSCSNDLNKILQQPVHSSIGFGANLLLYFYVPQLTRIFEKSKFAL